MDLLAILSAVSLCSILTWIVVAIAAGVSTATTHRRLDDIQSQLKSTATQGSTVANEMSALRGSLSSASASQNDIIMPTDLDRHPRFDVDEVPIPMGVTDVRVTSRGVEMVVEPDAWVLTDDHRFLSAGPGTTTVFSCGCRHQDNTNAYCEPAVSWWRRTFACLPSYGCDIDRSNKGACWAQKVVDGAIVQNVLVQITDGIDVSLPTGVRLIREPDEWNALPEYDPRGADDTTVHERLRVLFGSAANTSAYHVPIEVVLAGRRGRAWMYASKDRLPRGGFRSLQSAQHSELTCAGGCGNVEDPTVRLCTWHRARRWGFRSCIHPDCGVYANGACFVRETSGPTSAFR